MAPSTWFVKRHQPISKKNRSNLDNENARSFKFDKSKMVKAVKDTSPTKDTRHKVVWDGSSGTKVDAQVNDSNAYSERYLT